MPICAALIRALAAYAREGARRIPRQRAGGHDTAFEAAVSFQPSRMLAAGARVSLLVPGAQADQGGPYAGGQQQGAVPLGRARMRSGSTGSKRTRWRRSRRTAAAITPPRRPCVSNAPASGSATGRGPRAHEDLMCAVTARAADRRSDIRRRSRPGCARRVVRVRGAGRWLRAGRRMDAWRQSPYTRPRHRGSRARNRSGLRENAQVGGGCGAEETIPSPRYVARLAPAGPVVSAAPSVNRTSKRCGTPLEKLPGSRPPSAAGFEA